MKQIHKHHLIFICTNTYNRLFIKFLNSNNNTFALPGLLSYYNEVLLVMKYSLPHIEHGRHIPSRTKDVKGLWETVIVYQPSVDGEQAHHQDDITPLKECVPDLHIHIESLSYTSDILAFVKWAFKWGTHSPHSLCFLVCGCSRTAPSREQTEPW